jgi:hypothetical protein
MTQAGVCRDESDGPQPPTSRRGEEDWQRPGEPVDLLERSGIHQHAVVDVLVVLGDAELETPREEVRVLRDTDELTELRVGEVHDGLRRLETAIAALHDGPFASTRARRARDDEPTVRPVYEERPDTGGALFPLEMPSGLHDVGVNRDRDSQRHQHAHQRCQYFPRSSHESPPVGGQRVLASGV